jgi:HEPN domain-containing protein
MADEARDADEARRRAAAIWLAKATQDLQRVTRCMESPADAEDTLFHCQQAAEKAVKACSRCMTNRSGGCTIRARSGCVRRP